MRTALHAVVPRPLSTVGASTHTHTRARTHAHARARTHTRAHTHACTHTHTRTHTCTYASMHTRTHTHIRTSRVDFWISCSGFKYTRKRTALAFVRLPAHPVRAGSPNTPVKVLLG